MKKYSVLILILLPFSLLSQTIFWTEDFGSGCDQGHLATTYSGPNGTWTIVDSGVNEEDANTWFVSATENGGAVGDCHSGCPTPTTGNKTLHIANSVDISFMGIVTDQQCSYAEGIAGTCMPPVLPCTVTSKRVQSPTINCTGKSNITVNFKYIEGGDDNDNATMWYSADNGANWIMLVDMPKTAQCGTDNGVWTAFSYQLPASADNNPNVKIGFNWVNNGDGVAQDPSVAVDDITLSVIEVTPTCCDGDFNCDGVINVLDMIIIVNQFGCTTGCTADLDGDGIIGASDLTIFNGLYGDICP